MASYRFRLRDRRSSKTTSQSPSAFLTHCSVCGVIKRDPLLEQLNEEPVLLSNFAANLCGRTDQQIHWKLDIGCHANLCRDPRSGTSIIHHDQEVDVGIRCWRTARVGAEEDYFLWPD